MAVNKFLLKQAQLSVKQAFMPPEAAGGAPPMDPAMMGAAPSGAVPPGAMPPGGAPPMDPSMMGGAPPMDPSMMGGAPPMDPAAAAGDPAEQIRAVVQEEIQKAMAGVKGNGRSSKKSDGQNTEMFMRRIQKLLTHLYSSLGLNLPPDILDDTPGSSDDQSSKPSPEQSAQPASDASKLASHDNISEKAAGILYLLRKNRNVH